MASGWTGNRSACGQFTQTSGSTFVMNTGDSDLYWNGQIKNIIIFPSWPESYGQAWKIEAVVYFNINGTGVGYNNTGFVFESNGDENDWGPHQMPSLAIKVNNGTVTIYDTDNDMSIYWNS